VTDDADSQNHLDAPPMSHEDPGAVELVRFWITPDMGTQVSIRTAFDEEWDNPTDLDPEAPEA